MYETFLEYRHLPKPEIIKKLAVKLGFTASRIWIELESAKLGDKSIDYIINALKQNEKPKCRARVSFKKNPSSLSPLEKRVVKVVTPEKKETETTKKYRLNKDELEEKYVKQDKSAREIAEKCHVAFSTVYLWLKKFDIPRKIVSVKRPLSLGKPSKEELYREYIEEKKSIDEIAKIHSAGRNTIRMWLIKNEIPLRTLSEELLKHKKLPSREELDDLYIGKGMSMKKIAEMYKTGTRIIKRLLKNYDISVRSYEDALSLAALKGKRTPSKDELIKLYVEEGESIDTIAKIYGLSHPPIIRLFKKYDIKTRTRRQAALVSAKKNRKLNDFNQKTHEGLRALIELFVDSTSDEEIQILIKDTTLNYLNKLSNIYSTTGEENIMEEITLIQEHSNNPLEGVILNCLYSALTKQKCSHYLDSPKELSDGELINLEQIFINEVRKKYIEYTLEKRNNSHTINN